MARQDDVEVLGCLRGVAKSRIGIGITTTERATPGRIVRNICRVDMATNDMGDIDALGGVFADDGLDRLLLWVIGGCIMGLP